MKRQKNFDVLRPKGWEMWLYLIPGFILFIAFGIVPLIFAVYSGFHDFASLSNMEYVGLKYYSKMIHSSEFWECFVNNIQLLVGALFGQVILGFGYACIMSSKAVRARSVHRVIAFYPVTLSAIVIGFVWAMLFDYRHGLINAVFGLLGKNELIRDWLGDAGFVMTGVTLPLMWQYIGLYMVVFLAAMSSIDNSVLEMAEIDGANGWQRATKIILPLIKPTFITSLTMCTAGIMKTFDHIYIMTSGGPGYASCTLAMYAYKMAFITQNFGYGSACSVGIVLLSFTLIMVVKIPAFIQKRRGDE